MKKGFTLIELLAVIIILAIISLIATPTLINVIEEAKDKSDLESVHGILDSARLYYSESMMNSDAKNDIENLNNIYEKVSLSVKEKTGELYINDKGLSAVAIVIRNKCYTKQFSGELKISSNINNCTLGYVGNDETAPTVIFSVEDGVFNSNNWAKNNFNVNITINDNESGPSSYKYCIDTNICDPIALVNKSTGFSEINSESETNKVCVIGIDNYGNETEIICSNNYKLDKTNPTISVDNISINKNTVIDLNSDITTNDTLSGVDNVTYDPTDIDTSIAGDKKVTYTVTDKAGNSASIERTITVITDKPTVNFTTLTNPNSNGWFNSDFYIKATASVDNTTSVRSIKWCSSTSECVPTTVLESDNVTGYISTNSISNKMCVQITDQTGNESDVICSNNYKLDSIAPTIPTLDFNGYIPGNWTNQDVIVTSNSTDDLSGVSKYEYTHNGSNFTEWNENPKQWVINDLWAYIQIRAIDNAGNISISTQQYLINIDKVLPVHTNWWWGEATSSGASLYVQATDNVAIQRVQCPTSTETGGYSNWYWFDGVWDAGANAYRCDITSSTFGHYGNYLTHLYIYDYAGNGGYYNQTSINIKKPIYANNSVSTAVTNNGNYVHTVKSDGTLWYMYNSSSFSQVLGIDNVIGVSTSAINSAFNGYIVKSDGTLWHMLGAVSGFSQVTGIDNVIGVNTVVARGTGSMFTYIVKSDGTLWDSYNNGSFSQISGIDNVIGVSTAVTNNGNYVHIVKSDGTLWYMYNSSSFSQVSGIDNVIGVSTSAINSAFNGYIVKSDGTLWHMLGAVSGFSQVTGVDNIIGVNTVVASGTGSMFTNIVKSDGTLWDSYNNGSFSQTSGIDIRLNR